MQFGSGCNADAGDIPGVLGNLWFMKDDIDA
jgi:hypothetical protein